MAPDRNRLQALVDALPENEVPLAISFLSELSDHEIVDADTAVRLDEARDEVGDDVPLEDLRHRLGL